MFPPVCVCVCVCVHACVFWLVVCYHLEFSVLCTMIVIPTVHYDNHNAYVT